MNAQLRSNTTQQVLSVLNKSFSRIEPRDKDRAYSMGMSGCQGLCISYNLHSKRFCK